MSEFSPVACCHAEMGRDMKHCKPDSFFLIIANSCMSAMEILLCDGFLLTCSALAVLQWVAQLSDVIANILCLPHNVGFEDVVNTCHHFS